MEQCLRMTLWMLVLMGCAAEKGKGNCLIRHLHLLRDRTTCGPNVTFTSPRPVPDGCHASALNVTRDQVASVPVKCKDSQGRAKQVQTCLKELSKFSAATNSSGCSWDDQRFQKPFEDFVADIQARVEELNQRKTTPAAAQ